MSFLRKYSIDKLVLLLILGSICYGDAGGSFLCDDEHFIEKNETVHNLDIKAIYTESVTEGSKMPSNFYRPNQQLVYSLLYSVFGYTTSVPYHLTSALLHIFNSFLLLLFLASLGLRTSAQLAGAILFLIHPIQTEAVSYISGLSDPLGMFFLMSMLLTLQSGVLKVGHMPLRIGAIALLTALALLSKESFVVAMPLAIILCIFNYTYHKEGINKKFILIALILVSIICLLYLTLKFTVFNFTPDVGLSSETNAYTESIWIRLITFLSVQWEYFYLIVFPIDLSYAKPYTAYASIFTWQGAFGIATLLILLFALWKRQLYPLVFLGVFWFFGALGPFSGLVPLNATFLEHWLYVPFAGVAILFAALFENLSTTKWRKPLLVFSIVLGALLCSMTFLRNQEWGDIEKFYLNELEYRESALIHNNLAMHYASTERYEEAEASYKRAIEINDIYPQSHHNLARIYLGKNDIRMALLEYQKALTLSPRFIYSLYDLYDLFSRYKVEQKAQKTQELIEKINRGEPYPPSLLNDLFSDIIPPEKN